MLQAQELQGNRRSHSGGGTIDMPNKIVSVDAAVNLIRNGDTVTTSGFVGIGVPEGLLKALADRFERTGEPRGLALLFAAGQGDGKDKGLNHLAVEGMLSRVVGGHWGLIPKVARLALEGKIEAYNLPQGVISQMFRDIAAGKPGVLTRVGLDTFVDPILEGGKLNEFTTEDIVTRQQIGDESFLYYKCRPIDIALLRGTTADTSGNVTMEKEALTIDALAQAMAAKNSGGMVIVQVERTVASGTLCSRDVRIPAALVDAIVVAESPDHMQTFATAYSHRFTNRYRSDTDQATPMDLTPRKIIARRAAFELPVGGIVNLGIGMPEGVAAIAAEEHLLQHLTLTAEPGIIGGKPASGLDFGAAENADAIVDQNQQFDFYDGGGLDLAVLGMAQVDGKGSVNVSRFGPRLAGAGGFINISQNAKKLVFAGTFTSGGLKIAIGNGQLEMLEEGRANKFLESVEQVTFSGKRARQSHQPVLFVTERCVFRLCSDGIELIEIAPGVDLQSDILDRMEFRPIIHDPIIMDARIFKAVPMDLGFDLLRQDVTDRITLSEDEHTIFVNFERMRIRDHQDLDRVSRRVMSLCEPLGRKVEAIVNYDRTVISADIEDLYADVVRNLESRFYSRVTRYPGSAFMRMKLHQLFESK